MEDLGDVVNLMKPKDEATDSTFHEESFFQMQRK